MVPQLLNICPRHIRTMPLNAEPPVEITTSRRRLRDPGFKIRDRDLKKHSTRRDAKSPENETYHKRFRDFEIGLQFSETSFFQEPFYTP